MLVSTFGGLGLLAVFWPRVGCRWFLQWRAVLRHHSAPSLAAALFLAVMMLAHVSWNYRFYSVNRPRPYPFMRVLSQDQYWGRSFVTNNDDAAVWYVTRGWAYSISSAEPFYPAHAPQKYFADWKTNSQIRASRFLSVRLQPSHALDKSR